jgi:rhodanese-related sulfurtransferase
VKQKLIVGIREGIVILVISAVAGLVFNQVRKEGIPLIAAADAFRVETDAEFIKVDDARMLYEEGSAIFVDARAAEFFDIAHIEGAINVPPVSGAPDSLAYLLPADPAIVAYASEQSQRQAGVVADRLLEMGFGKVYVLYGGLEEWQRLDLPVEQRQR